jgi:hypothetical protein
MFVSSWNEINVGLTPHPGTPFHADSNELLFGLIALTPHRDIGEL